MRQVHLCSTIKQHVNNGAHTCPRVALRAPILLAWIRPSLFSLRNSLTNPFHCFIYSSSLSLRWTKQRTHTNTFRLHLHWQTQKCHLFMLSKLPHELHGDITWANSKLFSFLPALVNYTLLFSYKRRLLAYCSNLHHYYSNQCRYSRHRLCLSKRIRFDHLQNNSADSQP